MSAIAIIPARGGSKRIPGKNVRWFHGKQIIRYSLEAARNADVFDTIAVSTDDVAVAAIAWDFGAEVLWRPPALCDDESGTDDVMQYHMKRMPHEAACCIYSTAPMIDYWDIRRGYQELKERDGATFVFTMGVDPNQDAAHWYWGWRKSWVEKQHFVSPRSVIFQIPAHRHCDINTEEDWKRAEEMYARLHHND